MPNTEPTPDLQAENDGASASFAFEENPFLMSLYELQPDQITPVLTAPKAKKKFDPFIIVKIILLIICVCTLLYCARLLVVQLQQSIASSNTYSDLSEQFWGNENSAILQARQDLALLHTPDYSASQSLTDYSDFLTPPTYNEHLEKIKARLRALKAINKEIYGYIYIEDTEIDYPLVQHSDNSYYLNHDFAGKYSGTGSIFVDYRNTSPLESNKNTILYGHHMSSGSTMFHTLDYFFDEEFFISHPDIYIYTFDGIYQFKVFATYITKQDYPYIRTVFETDEDFIRFCEEMRSNSRFFREGVSFTKDSCLLTLSTCTNIVKSDRICIQAVLEKIER